MGIELPRHQANEMKVAMGMCPTCEAKILSGDMCISEDHILTESPDEDDVFYCDRCDAEFTFAELTKEEN